MKYMFLMHRSMLYHLGRHSATRRNFNNYSFMDKNCNIIVVWRNVGLRYVFLR